MKNISHWPFGLPLHLQIPKTSLFYNLEVSARRYPDRAAIVYYGSELTYLELKRQVDVLAGFLQRVLNVVKGDRVALYLQNSPQFVISYYAILRIGAVVVPVNTMNLLEEVRHIVSDSGSKAIIFGQELAAHAVPLLGQEIQHAIVASYSQYIVAATDLPLPEVVAAAPYAIEGVIDWRDALRYEGTLKEVDVRSDDLAVLPYTSGTTGVPKGCMHTHHTVMHTTVGGEEWSRAPKDSVVLAALPMFHVTGMQNGLNTPIFGGSTVVIMTRWDKRCVAMLIERYKVSAWTAIPTMLFDFLNQPNLADYDLSSLSLLTGGGAAMPKAVADRIRSLWGIDYIEGYGLSETIAPTHVNPPDRPKPQCMGLPIFDTEALIVDPSSMTPLRTGEVGEIIVSGPQVFLGYFGNEAATADAFVNVDGRRYFRTGDLGRVDDDGYFFLVDRLKRMINASGYKVWPTEVEALLYGHPGVLEACVIAYRDEHRGEGVKALVVKRPGHEIDAGSFIAWARDQMAAYKAPQLIEFRDSLPKSGTGKVQWRQLQEEEIAATRELAAPTSTQI